MTAAAWSGEVQTRLALGAIRFVDGVTGRSVRDVGLDMAPGFRWLRKPDGLVVLLAGPTGAGVSTARPGFGYAPRRFTLVLPRRREPGFPDSVGRPVEVVLHPATGYPVLGNVASVTLVLRRDGDGSAIGGALVRLLAGAEPVAAAVSNRAGEALLAVPDLKVIDFDADGHPSQDRTFALQVLVDPALAAFTPPGDVAAAMRSDAWTAPVDPDDLAARTPSLLAAAAAVAPATITLRAGRSTPSVTATWTPAPPA